MPVAHASVSKILEDGTKGPQPLNVEHHFIVYQRNDEEVRDERLWVDEEMDVVADTGAGHLIVIGNRHLKARTEDRLKVQTTCHFSGDE
jgi:hypothetical protein